MSDTGLRRPDLISATIDRVMRVESQWLHESTSPRQRLELLVDCVFPALDSLSIPRCPVAYELSLGSPTLLGTFDTSDWTLRLSMSAVSSEIVSRDKEEALSSALGTTYHETRHFEQNFRARYYYLLQPKAAGIIKNNAPLYAGRDGKIRSEILERSFHLPRWLAEALWTKFVRKDRYAGQELEEARAWYEESIGAHKDESARVMGDLDQMWQHRQTIYCLYRTLVMEDDAFEAGYLVGDQYLKRTFQEKHGELGEKERILKTQKQTLIGKVTEMREKANLLISQGEDSKAVRAMVEQFYEKQRRVKDMILGVETKLNADKKLIEGREFSANSLIKSHNDSMTEYRVTAHQKRWKYGRLNYLGTASSTGRR